MNQLITYFITTTGLTAALVYLAKLVIEKLADAKFEKYKVSLLEETERFRHGLNIEAEKFKHELNTVGIEHQIRYSKLYEERGQVVKSIFKLLLELEKSLASLTTLVQGPEWTTDNTRDLKVKECIAQLQKHLEENRIFFSEPLCIKIESILADAHQITVDMFVAKQKTLLNEHHHKIGRVVDVDELLRPHDIWQELDIKVQKDIKRTKLDLAQEFRVLIGVS